MQLEIDVATNFLLSFAYIKVPRHQADAFKKEMTRTLSNLYQGHWYPNDPSRGSAFRSLSISDRIDPSIEAAAVASGIDVGKLRDHLPRNLTLWVDPCEVSYRIGEKGEIATLWQEQQQQQQHHHHRHHHHHHQLYNRNDSHSQGDSRKHTAKASTAISSPQSSVRQEHWLIQRLNQQIDDEWSRSPGKSTNPVHVPLHGFSKWSPMSSMRFDLCMTSSSYERQSSSSLDSGLAEMGGSPCSSGLISSPSSEDESDSSPRTTAAGFFTYRGEVYSSRAVRTTYFPPEEHMPDVLFSPSDHIVVS